MESVVVRYVDRSRRLSGAKKRARLFRGLSTIRITGQPSKGKGSLPCRLVPPDFWCQVKTTAIRLGSRKGSIESPYLRARSTLHSRFNNATHDLA
jgi:hypothetical protein